MYFRCVWSQNYNTKWFKKQSSGTLKILADNCNHQQGLVKQKLLLSIIVVLWQNFVNTFIKIPILGKLYQCSSCYAKLEQHWIECICVLSNAIIQCLVHIKVRLKRNWSYLTTLAIISKCLLNKKLWLCIILVWSQNFLNIQVSITILSKLYRCSSCYSKFEQHWIRCLCVRSSSIM